MTTTYTALTVDEKKELSTCRATVTKHLKSFLPAGKALHVINSKGLYRDEAGTTFEEFAKSAFGFNNRQSAYRFINAYLVVEKLKSLGFDVLPDRESQCRHLTVYLEDQTGEKLSALWNKVIASMLEKGTGLTAPLIKAACTSENRKEGTSNGPQSGTGGTSGGDEGKGTGKDPKGKENTNNAPDESQETIALLRAELKASQERTKQAQEKASKLLGELNKLQREQQGKESKYKGSGLYKELVRAGYKTLSQTMHPDKGGDEELMKALNALYADLNK